LFYRLSIIKFQTPILLKKSSRSPTWHGERDNWLKELFVIQ
jgi:hypothetical protein